MKFMAETKFGYDLSCFKKTGESGGVTQLRDIIISKKSNISMGMDYTHKGRAPEQVVQFYWTRVRSLASGYPCH